MEDRMAMDVTAHFHPVISRGRVSGSECSCFSAVEVWVSSGGAVISELVQSAMVNWIAGDVRETEF